jgi:hypothetical protein
LGGAAGSWVISRRNVAGLRKKIPKMKVELIVSKVSLAEMTEMAQKLKDQRERMIQASEKG